MRNIELISETARTIRDNGNVVHIEHGPYRTYWAAGQERLNWQAVSDLVADGWLKEADNKTLRLDAFPPFAA